MSTYPPVAAGQRITGGLLQSMLPQQAVKQVDSPATNTTVLQPDNELVLPVVAGATYHGRLTLFYVAPVAQDLRYSWLVPAGSTGRRGLIGPDPTTTASVDLTAMQSRVSGAFGTDFIVGGAAGSHKVAYEHFELVTTAAGNVQLQFAQGTAAAATTSTVLAWSSLKLQRVA